MAQGFTEFTLDSIKTPDGISQINSIIRQLYDNIAGDAENIRVFTGYGSPEGVLTAGISSLYLRADGGAGTSIYVKESGTGNTGWMAISGATPVTFPLSVINGGTGIDFSAGTSGNYLGFTSTGIIGQITPPIAINTSNVLFQYIASVDTQGTAKGEIQATSLAAVSGTTNYRYLGTNNTSLETQYSTKFKKISGVNTITVYFQQWVNVNTRTATLKVNIGTTNNTRTENTNTAPTWQSFTIDVSGLSNGTVYDVTVQLSIDNGAGWSYMGNMIAFGS